MQSGIANEHQGIRIGRPDASDDRHSRRSLSSDPATPLKTLQRACLHSCLFVSIRGSTQWVRLRLTTRNIRESLFPPAQPPVTETKKERPAHVDAHRVTQLVNPPRVIAGKNRNIPAPQQGRQGAWHHRAMDHAKPESGRSRTPINRLGRPVQRPANEGRDDNNQTDSQRNPPPGLRGFILSHRHAFRKQKHVFHRAFHASRIF